MLSESLEVLLQTKSFGELTEKEQRLALQEITVEEYAQFHSLLGVGTKALQQVPAMNAGIEGRLQNHLQHVWQQPNPVLQKPWWQSLFTYQVPLWQTALGAMLLLIYFNWQQPVETILVKTAPEKVYVYQTDTVYKNKIPDTVLVSQVDTQSTVAQFPKKQPQRRINVNVKPSLQKEIILNSANNEPPIVTHMITELPALNNEITTYKGMVRGRTVKEDSSLYRMTGL